MGDECFNVSGSPNGFNVANCPVGLYTSSSGCSEFGGLGSLGLSGLAASSQFGAFPGKNAHNAVVDTVNKAVIKLNKVLLLLVC